MGKRKIMLKDIMLFISIILIFVLVGIFSKVNPFSEQEGVNSSNFIDTGKKCVIDNVSYDVIVDNYSNVVYIMNPRNDTLTLLYDKNLKPMTSLEYNFR